MLNGATETDRIMTISAYMDGILLDLDLSKQEIKNLFFDLLQIDYQTCMKGLKTKALVLSLPDKMFLERNNIPPLQMLIFSDDKNYTETIRQMYPEFAKDIIEIIETSRGELDNIVLPMQFIKTNYLDNQRKIPKKKYKELIKNLKELGIHGDLLKLLKEEIIKDIQEIHKIPKEEKTTVIKTTEPRNHQNTLSIEKQKETAAKMHELKKYFNQKLGEAPRPLKIEEQIRLVELLQFSGYTEAQCKDILKTNRRTEPALENFPQMDLLEKIEFVKKLRKTYHTEQEIIEILNQIAASDITKEDTLSKTKRIMRNASIIKIIMKYTEPLQREELNQIRKEIQALRRIKSENSQKEIAEWKEYFKSLLIQTYQNLDNQIELEESKTKKKIK